MDVIAESVVSNARQLSNRRGDRSALKRKRAERAHRTNAIMRDAKRRDAGAFVFIIFFEAANSIRVASALNAPRRCMHLNEIVNLYSAFSRTN